MRPGPRLPRPSSATAPPAPGRGHRPRGATAQGPGESVAPGRGKAHPPLPRAGEGRGEGSAPRGPARGAGVPWSPAWSYPPPARVPPSRTREGKGTGGTCDRAARSRPAPAGEGGGAARVRGGAHRRRAGRVLALRARRREHRGRARRRGARARRRRLCVLAARARHALRAIRASPTSCMSRVCSSPCRRARMTLSRTIGDGLSKGTWRSCPSYPVRYSVFTTLDACQILEGELPECHSSGRRPQGHWRAPQRHSGAGRARVAARAGRQRDSDPGHEESQGAQFSLSYMAWF